MFIVTPRYFAMLRDLFPLATIVSGPLPKLHCFLVTQKPPYKPGVTTIREKRNETHNWAICRRGNYSPERTMGMVGVLAPPAFSMVMPKALAGTPLGSVGRTTEAYPSPLGVKVPAGMGAPPLAGMTHSS